MDIEDMRVFAPLMSSFELADYLCRSEAEVIAKAEEMGLKFNI